MIATAITRATAHPIPTSMPDGLYPNAGEGMLQPWGAKRRSGCWPGKDRVPILVVWGDYPSLWRAMESVSNEVAPRRVVNDDDLTVGESLDRMADIPWHDRDQTRSGDLSRAVNGHLEFALDHLWFAKTL